MRRVPHTSSNLRVFGGSSHPELTRLVSKKVGVRPGEVKLDKFANKETGVQILENVRGENVYLIQTGGGKRPNDDLMELLLLINGFKLSAAGVITVIAPFFPYSKRDKKAGSRVPISSKLVADLMKRAGADSVMMLDPHTPQLEGFFNMPTDALQVNPLFCEWIKHHVPDWEDCVILSPDEGGAQKAASVAADLGIDFAMISSRDQKSEGERGGIHHGRGGRARRAGSERSDAGGGDHPQPTEKARQDSGEFALSGPSGRRKLHRLSGSVRGRTVVVVDDMIDTGVTLRIAAEVLRREGAEDFYMVATHGLFSGGAIEAIQDVRYASDHSPSGADGSHNPFLRGIVVSNSIKQEENRAALNTNGNNLLSVLDISSLVAEFIRRHHYRESISCLSQFMPIRDVIKAGMGGNKSGGSNAAAGSSSNNVQPSRKKSSVISVPAYDLSAVMRNQEGRNEEIVAEEGGLPAAQVVEDLEGDAEEAAGGDGDGEEGADDAEEDDDVIDKPTNLRLQRVRKGFRLSSVCWEDQDGP